MVIFPLAPDQTIAQMWSNGARGGSVHTSTTHSVHSSYNIESVSQTHNHVVIVSQTLVKCHRGEELSLILMNASVDMKTSKFQFKS